MYKIMLGMPKVINIVHIQFTNMVHFGEEPWRMTMDECTV
jgi:hypothetical protein